MFCGPYQRALGRKALQELALKTPWLHITPKMIDHGLAFKALLRAQNAFRKQRNWAAAKMAIRLITDTVLDETRIA